jgi:hypothetical protein
VPRAARQPGVVCLQTAGPATRRRFRFGADVLERAFDETAPPQESEAAVRRKVGPWLESAARALTARQARGWRRARNWIVAIWGVTIIPALMSATWGTISRLRRVERLVRWHLRVASNKTVSAHQSAPGIIAVGLRRGGRRVRENFGAALSAVVTALGIFGRMTILGTRRGIRAVRRSAVTVWDRIVSALGFVGRTTISGTRHGAHAVRSSAVTAWSRCVPLARSIAQSATVRRGRVERVVRKSVGAASARFMSALGSIARTAMTGVGRGGRTLHKSAGISWDRTVTACSSLVRTVMVASRRGEQQSRAWVVDVGRLVVEVGKLAVRVVKSGAYAVAAGVNRGVRLVGENVAASRQACPALDGVAFEVVNGLHGGVRLMLESGEYGIGSTPEADIVLRDPGVMPGHAVLGVQRGRVRLEATGGDIGVGTQIISQGHGCRLGLPLELSLGGASMRLSRIETRAADRSRFAIAGLAACLVVAVAVVIVGFLREEVKAGSSRIATNLLSSESRTGTATPGREDGSADSDRASTRAVPLIAEAMHELIDRINAANIRTLRVSVVEGRLAVSGALGPQDTPAWSAIQQWFDQTYHGRLVLTTNLGSGEGRTMPTLQLRAVWFGDRPYVITAEGAHFNQGAILDNGWLIQDIGQDRIVLIKKGETVTLTYR